MSENWEKRARAAEATSTVLKRRVKALYNGESTSVIQRQLERAQHRQEEARRKRELTEVRAAELAKYSHGLELEVAERTRVLRTILDNVTSGFLVVEGDLRIAPGYTRSCHALLGTEELAGRGAPEAFGRGDARLASQLRLALLQVFADILPEEVCLDAVPKRIKAGDRVLRVDASAIRGDDGAVREVLLTLNDATSLENAQREARENKGLIGILRQREAFRDFVSDTRELLSSAREALDDGDEAFYRRALHTVKGNASAFDLESVVRTIHEIEAKPEIVRADVDAAEAEVRGFLERHSSVLEIEYDVVEETSYEVPERRVDVLASITKPQDLEIKKWTAELVLKRADAVLGPIDCYVAKLSERLEKQVTFVLTGGEVKLDARRVRPVARILSHLLRNSVDHGIEAGDERGAKDVTGRIEVRVEDGADAWVISVIDDGRGIDCDALAMQAAARGLIPNEVLASMTEAEKAALIFMDGLSSKEVASDISGRGVGMGAVKAAVEAEGGEVDVHSTRGEGTRVMIRLPKPESLRERRTTSMRAPRPSMSPVVGLG